MRNKIIAEMMSCGFATSYEAVETYIDFCLANRTSNGSETALHHILPRAKSLPWQQYDNLMIHSWNGVRLTHYHHYIAHFLLTQALNHRSALFAFCAMHNKDHKLKRISLEQLIDETTFTQMNKHRNSALSEFLKEEIIVDGVAMSNAKARYLKRSPATEEEKQRRCEKMVGEKNIIHMAGVLPKIRETKLSKNLDKISAERAAQTMKTPIQLQDGTITTQYEQNGLKISKTLNEEITTTDGGLSTRAMERGKVLKQQMREKSQKYKVLNVFNPEWSTIMTFYELRQLSGNLPMKTKENYAGMSTFAKTMLTKNNKAHLIGLYVEKLQ